jgi:hypothetical protein
LILEHTFYRLLHKSVKFSKRFVGQNRMAGLQNYAELRNWSR